MKSQVLKVESNSEQSERSDGSLSLAILSTVKKYPNSAYDLAICLYTMDAYKESLSILNTLDSKASHFLKLEAYYEDGQYIDALSHTDVLLEKYAIDSEAILTVIYTRAKCLWALGKKCKARSLMSEIISQNPDFRDAQSLLFRWNKKAES